MSIKHAVINFLKADAGVSGLVGSRVTPRSAPAKSAYPLLILHKISEQELFAHSGNISVIQTRLQIDLVAKTDLEIENLVVVIKNRLHLFQGTYGSYEILLATLENVGDSIEENFFDEELLLSSMDFIINWRNI